MSPAHPSPAQNIKRTQSIKAAHGSQITAKSWQTEAPMRMLMNNLDPEVAEQPENLIVYDLH